MKKVYALLSLFLMRPAYSQLSWEEPDLIGPVKTVRIEAAKFLLTTSDELVEGPRTLTNAITFDTKECVTEKSYYHGAEGSLSSREVYRYDNKGRRIEVLRYDGGGSLKVQEFYRYDGNRRLEVTTCCKADGSTYLSEVKIFDDKGVVIERLSYFPNGVPINKGINRYDAKGRLIESISFTTNGSGKMVLATRTVIHHDSADSLEALNYNADDSPNEKCVYRLDAHRYVSESAFYDASGSLLNKTLFSYDYDSHGNWIKKTTSNCVIAKDETNCAPTEVTYRSITYY